jgi:hypothetical protein
VSVVVAGVVAEVVAALFAAAAEGLDVEEAVVVGVGELFTTSTTSSSSE